MQAQATPPRSGADDTLPPVDVEIVIPVLNEEQTLAANVLRVHRFLTAELPYSWRLTIAENGSSDRTPAIARSLAEDLECTRLVAVQQRGRGRAIKQAWASSRARVVAYMDVDLSTDLRALLPLIAPLISGHSEIAIGTRLGPGARVTRGIKRSLISRTYNLLLRATLRARFSDAQCGFKAVRADVLPALLSGVQDDGWFFDTELLMLAQRSGWRIYEVPVDWIDDPDSRVRIIKTATADLRGIARLLIHRATPTTSPLRLKVNA